MHTIGLIGGMSWESTAVYYRYINELVREQRGGLHSAEILLHSLDFERVVERQKAGDWPGAAAILGDAAEWLVTGGADTVLICTNTMHIVAEAVAARVRMAHPTARLVNIIDETAVAVRNGGCRRPLLLATRYTMEHGFYTERMRARGVAVKTPEAADRLLVHDVIFSELCHGVVSDLSRARLMEVIRRGLAAGADGVILGCTELCLILDPAGLHCPAFDSTRIHAAAAVTSALGDEGTGFLQASAFG